MKKRVVSLMMATVLAASALVGCGGGSSASSSSDAAAEAEEEAADEATVVKSRIETYQGADGNKYGVPFHVGATLMYYNLAELESVGITQADVDAIKG